MHFDRFEIDSPRGTIRLTTREMGLLRALIDREGEAVTRGELLEEVWGLRPDTKTRDLEKKVKDLEQLAGDQALAIRMLKKTMRR